MVKTKNDQTLWLRWISDPYASCFSWKCPFRRLLWSLLFHVYLAVDGDGEAKNIHLPERLGQPKNSVATVCLFYIAKRWHGMWIWISSLQAVDWTCKFIICFNLWTTPYFSRSNVDTQLQRPFNTGRNKDKVGVEKSMSYCSVSTSLPSYGFWYGCASENELGIP